jgi:hypothetical protein
MSGSLRLLAVAVAAVLLGACGPDEPRPTPISPARTEASIVRSGFSVRDGRIGVAALVRVRGDRTVHAIRLRVSLFSNGRRIGRSQSDVLPYCPPSTDCWWGQSFFGDQLDQDWRSVDRVVLSVDRVGDRVPSESIVSNLRTSVQGDDVLVTPPGTDGTAYLLALRGSQPSYGISFVVRGDENETLRYGKDQLPVDKRDRVIGVFYPGRVPFGPAD